MNNWNQAKDEYQRITRQQQLADEQKQWQQKQLTILAQQEKDTQQAQDKLRKEHNNAGNLILKHSIKKSLNRLS